MRIGVNLLYLRPGKVGGSEIYIRELIKELSKFTEVTLILFCGTEASQTFNSSENLEIVKVFNHSFNQMRRVLAENILLRNFCQSYKVDILFSPANFGVPLLQANIPQVITVHDLQHKYLKSYFSKAKYMQREILFRLSFAKAKKIIAISDFTRKGIIENYGLEENKIKTVYEGITDKFSINASDLKEIQDKFQLKQNFFYYPAMLAPHKNHLMLLNAFSDTLQIMKDKQCNLVFSGYKDERWELIGSRIRSLGIKDRVIHLGYLTRRELFGVMTLATAMVFPSRFEGFGLPILEAMQCGTPVVASDCTSIPEVAGDAALLIKPEDQEGWTKALIQISADEKIRKKLTSRGTNNAKRFSWVKCAEETVKCCLNTCI